MHYKLQSKSPARATALPDEDAVFGGKIHPVSFGNAIEIEENDYLYYIDNSGNINIYDVSNGTNTIIKETRTAVTVFILVTFLNKLSYNY